MDRSRVGWRKAAKAASPHPDVKRGRIPFFSNKVMTPCFTITCSVKVLEPGLFVMSSTAE